MSLPTNDKKGDNKQNKKQNNQGGQGSKFIKGSSKQASVTKKVRSTGANRGS
jgi:hypothetical protein